MAIQSRLTTAEFDKIVALPENTDKRLELVGGEVVEVASNNYASMIAARILGELQAYCKGKNIGYITGADGGYMVSGERYIPDIGFISKQRQPTPSHETYNSNAPDLAVEVVSPTDVGKEVLEKVANYLAAGTRVWVVYPSLQQVKVFEPGQAVKTVNADDTLNGGTLLPGLTIQVADLFADQDE